VAKHSERFLRLVDETRKLVRETTVPEVYRRIARGEKLVLIDTREDDEWRASRIPGAVHLGKGVLERDVEGQFPDLKQELILYCGGGFRSVLAAYALQQMGYENVVSMDGGIREWREAGHALDETPV
jgi:rhodanese-related sulfurtransferase